MEKFNLLKGLLLASAVSFFSFTLQGQGNELDLFENLSKVPSHSPNVAALMKYVEVPVNHYNGLEAISVPLYHVIEGDISVPLSVSYHSGGIKVAEEASWVGLGWSLNAGGVISRSVNGTHDLVDVSGKVFNQIFPDNKRGQFDPENANSLRIGACNLYDAEGNIISKSFSNFLISEDDIDGEPDIFMYNFGPYQGKFFVVGSKYYDISRNNIKFEVGYESIVATAPDGFVYTFEAREMVQIGPNPYHPGAFYLTEVKSPHGKKVTFQYKSFDELLDENPGHMTKFTFPSGSITSAKMPVLSEQYLVKNRSDQGSGSGSNSFFGHKPKTYSISSHNPLYLDKILFSNGYIEFVKSPRTDVREYKLDEIIIKDLEGEELKRIQFVYDMFVSNDIMDYLNGSSDPFVPEYPEQYRSSRLKLNAIREVAANEQPKEHKFEYYENGKYKLPYKSSWAQDFWGYYNSKGGNRTFIPSGKYFNYSGNDLIKNFVGANRMPDSASMKAATLKKIIYPTGGYVEFEHSPHQFTNSIGLGSWQEVIPIEEHVYDYNTLGGKSHTFVLDDKTLVDIYVELLCTNRTENSPNEWGLQNCGCVYNDKQILSDCNDSPVYALYAMIEKLGPNGWIRDPEMTFSKEDLYPTGFDDQFSIYDPGGIFTVERELEPGTYRLTANYPDHLTTGSTGQRWSQIKVTYDKTVINSPNANMGGGLRIDKIETFDPFTGTTNARLFDYSGGKLMSFPMFYWHVLGFEVEAGGDPNTLIRYSSEYLYSSTSVPYSTSASGSHVGYSSVKEINNSFANGWIEYEYANKEDKLHFHKTNSYPDSEWAQLRSYAPRIPSTSYQTNGFLLSKKVYNTQNQLLHETLSKPLIVNPETFWSFQQRRTTEVQTAVTNPDRVCEDDPRSWYNLTYFYPIQLGKLLIDETTESSFFYDAGGALKSTLMTTIKNTYNNQGFLASEISYSSEGNKYEKLFKYPLDYDNVVDGWLYDLKEQNNISSPVEIKVNLNGSTIKSSLVNYKTTGEFTSPHNFYQFSKNRPAPTRQWWVPYSSIPADYIPTGTLEFEEGNISEVKGRDGIVTSYIWGHNKVLPIVKAIGVSYSILSSAYASVGGAEADVSQLHSHPDLQNALIYTYEYVPLKGMVVERDQNGNQLSYDYDAFSRLKFIKDHENNIIKAYEYNYVE